MHEKSKKILNAKISLNLEDLNDENKQKIADQVNPLVADIFALFVKTKNYHWHISGKNFRDYHLMLDEQAGQLLAMVDILAERVRKLGKLTIKSIDQIQSLKHIEDDNDAFVEPKEMLTRLMNDNKIMLSNMRSTHEICSDSKDVATTSVLENFIDETEERIWFLYETIAD